MDEGTHLVECLMASAKCKWLKVSVGMRHCFHPSAMLVINSNQLPVENKFPRYLLNATSDIAYSFDSQGHLLHWNTAMENFCGLPPDKMKYRLFKSFICDQDRQTVIEDIKQAFAKGAHINVYRFIRSDGCLVPFHCNGTVVYNERNEPEGVAGIGRDMSEQLKSQERLQRSEELLRETQELAGVGSYLLDISTGIWESSIVLDRLLGISETYDRTIEGWSAVIHPDDRSKMVDFFRVGGQGKDEVFDMEYRIIRINDQAERWMHGLGKIEFDNRGRPRKMLGTIQDITVSKLAEENLRISATIFESQEGMLITDDKGCILKVNHAFRAITGYTEDEVIGKNPRILHSGRHEADFYIKMWQTIQRRGFWEGEIWNKRKNGEVYPERLIITAVKNANGVTTNFVGTLTDITLSRAASDEIEHLAYFDILTRLPNRRLLLDRLSQASISSARSGRQGALIFIDLDNFKMLNDSLGHDIGDMLLQQVALRLESCIRDGDTVARLGGDEFVVMLENLSERASEAAKQAETIGNKILDSLNGTYLITSHEHHNSPSIGITLFCGKEQNIEELLKQADIAMYQAKKFGRNRICFFDQHMQDTVNVRVALERDLRKAHEYGYLQLHYQVQVNDFGKPLGAEALIRWSHPERGLINPSLFIPLAEESGLILPIGQWVLDTACAQLKVWEKDTLTSGLVLAVNVSAKQFRQPGFVAQVHSAMQKHAIKPNLLKLELTESMLFENIEATILTMHELRSVGIKFAMDDFGTGYSSLQYIKRLPLDQLKIDSSFVREIETDGSDRAIVRAIILMAQSLKLDVIAEGVETNEQQQILLDMGCQSFQGYLFSKPVPIGQLEVLLEQACI
jgi:diguanylate cyclase (GGDEF)-like protein/PAS domain S-box-containing protein